jgi:hypothetical protein
MAPSLYILHCLETKAFQILTKGANLSELNRNQIITSLLNRVTNANAICNSNNNNRKQQYLGKEAFIFPW